ncbi:unnamed protein product [Penicillium salamii]|uniref:Nephrocystin 3-like N-terminal domain-containing protein n=1 Tax=Penicillium salamii TaxID=1612424 RepID=A0A9W4JST4_9EURO|nr:unnamed protein product [Penicillium salamii]
MGKGLKSWWKEKRMKNRSQQHEDGSDEVRSNQILESGQEPNHIIPTNEKEDPRDLWHAAFEKLDEKQKCVLMSNPSEPDEAKSEDVTGRDIKITLDQVVEIVNRQNEIGKVKGEKRWLNGVAQKVLGSVLALQSNVSAIVACDPTGHASSAWAVISLGLTSYRKHQEVWLQSAEYLSDTISRMLLTEIAYRSQGATKDGVETSLERMYLEILRYSAEIKRIQQSNKVKKWLDTITEMNAVPLEDMKKCIIEEKFRLERWLSMQQFLGCREDAAKILAQGAEILKVVHNLDESLRDSKLHAVESEMFGTYQKYPADECLPGTRTEILQKITDWIDSPSGEALFWLEGMAGTGKSTISRSFARSMKDRGLLAATFFFNRGESDRANLRRFAPTIARQLADAVPVLREDILEAANFASAEFAVQFTELLSKPLSKLKTPDEQRLPQVIVIDALDECEDGSIHSLVQLLSQLNYADSPIDLRIFITSRPENPISPWLQKVVEEKQTMILEKIDQSTIGDDISLFFESKLIDIRDARPDESLQSGWPGPENIQRLIRMAVPLFISAATIYRELMDTDSLAEIILSEIFANSYQNSNLATTYRPALNKLLRGRSKEQSAKIAQEVRLIVGAVVLLEDLLPISSLAKLINVSDKIVMKRVRSISSVLMVPSNTDEPARAFHKSFRDFILDPETDRNLFGVDPSTMHMKLALDCVNVMQRAEGGLRKNICRLESYGILRTQIDDARISRHMPKELNYACRHWVNHLRLSETSISDGDEIHSFLESHFLSWVEAMIIWGYIPEPIKGVGNGSALSQFLYDAKRFLRKNTAMIEEMPLQIYSSGLIFAPYECTIRKTFQKLIPQCFTQLPCVKSKWGPALQTVEVEKFEGTEEFIDDVALSPDGSLLVSGSLHTLKLWNTETGTLRQNLEENFHGPIYVILEEGDLPQKSSVEFSPDGKLIASVIDNRTVRLWDVTSGLVMLQRTLTVVEDGVPKVAFSPGSEYLALACRDSTVQIWCLKTASLQQILEGHTSRVEGVAFSPDGRFLASASADCTVRLWDVASRPFKLHTTLNENCIAIGSVAFSPDSRILALASRKLMIWDVLSGELRKTISIGSRYSIKSIAFSNDGKSILSASDRTVDIWSVSQDVVRTLYGPDSYVQSLSLSSDGTLLAGCSLSKIWLWDIPPSSWPEDFQTLRSEAELLLFSPDSRLVASSSQTDLTLWDPYTGERLFIRSHGVYSTESVVFSPDSKLIASGSSSDYTLRMWSTETWRRTIRMCEDEVPSAMAFSLDGKLMAGVDRSYITIWDMLSGKPLRTIDVIGHEPKSPAFSNDGKILASGHGRIIDREKEKEQDWDRDCAGSDSLMDLETSGTQSSTSVNSITVTLWDTDSGALISTLRSAKEEYDRIEALTFSPDDRLLVTSSLHVKPDLDLWPRFWFSEDGGTLKTNRGSYQIHRKKPDGPVSFSKTESLITALWREEWLQYKQQNILWLPPEYRPRNIVVRDNLVALGHYSGDVSFIRFKDSAGDELDGLLNP